MIHFAASSNGDLCGGRAEEVAAAPPTGADDNDALPSLARYGAPTNPAEPPPPFIFCPVGRGGDEGEGDFLGLIAAAAVAASALFELAVARSSRSSFAGSKPPFPLLRASNLLNAASLFRSASLTSLERRASQELVRTVLCSISVELLILVLLLVAVVELGVAAAKAGFSARMRMTMLSSLSSLIGAAVVVVVVVAAETVPADLFVVVSGFRPNKRCVSPAGSSGKDRPFCFTMQMSCEM
mmetsp:Transcript_7856/g.12773  ORF Transcript_7856/g.12773 Transcript_7856/m.12773 type:complete len:240 (-) Transcript_7856:97-816(-)